MIGFHFFTRAKVFLQVATLVACLSPSLVECLPGSTLHNSIVIQADGVTDVGQAPPGRARELLDDAVVEVDKVAQASVSANQIMRHGIETYTQYSSSSSGAYTAAQASVAGNRLIRHGKEILIHHSSVSSRAYSTEEIVLKVLTRNAVAWGFLVLGLTVAITLAIGACHFWKKRREHWALLANQDIANEGPLMKAFVAALNGNSMEGSSAAMEFVEKHRSSIGKVLDLFSADGRLIGRPIPASCYNDLYKWTMYPVIAAVEGKYDSDVQCTFSVNIRDANLRKQLLQSATGEASSVLYNELKSALADMALRPFDRSTFERCAKEYNIPGWDQEALDSVCGTALQPRMLIQQFREHQETISTVLPSSSATQRGSPRVTPRGPPALPGTVSVFIYVAQDEKLKEKRVYIEASGPWHLVTWLETSMMQCVYDVCFRAQKCQQYGEESALWYPRWLAEAFCRCTRSVAAAVQCQIPGALFTGRRTGGLALMMLQGLYVQHAFKSIAGKSMMLGSSSVTARYMSLDAGVPGELVPQAAGTHAHELSMVLGSLLGEVDDEAGMPLSQLVGHMLYFYLSRPAGDVTDAARKSLMPMLPDTLGSRAFMKEACKLIVPRGPHKGQPILSIMGAARQDSGCLEDFKKLMDEFDFKGALMASEIETEQDLLKAVDNGYSCFGAGGFMGDSEKAWDPSKQNISMACKVLRVYVQGEIMPAQHSPVKTGEISHGGKIKEGKFEADGTLTQEQIQHLKRRSQGLANAVPLLADKAIAKLFENTLARFLPSTSD